MVDYEGSARQHHENGECLHRNHRFPGADQLAGLAAECAIKTILVKIVGARVDARGNILRPYREHVDKLWSVAAAVPVGPTQAAYFAPLLGGNPFADWRVDDRYTGGRSYATGAVVGDPTARAHLDSARDVILEIDQARIDGVIR